MKNRDIMNAMNGIDFDMIEDAGRVTRKTSVRRKVTRWSSLAACVCVVLALIPVLFRPSAPSTPGDAGTPPRDETLSPPYTENPPGQNTIPSPPYMETPPAQNANSPLYHPFAYDTFDEFKDAICEENEDELYAELLEQEIGNGQADIFLSFVRKFRAQRMRVPYIGGEVAELRNEEGFSNISFFISELYDLPWIFYHPYVSTGENFYIKMTYVPDYVLKQMENPTASEVIRALSPNSPNVGNLGKNYKNIYNQTIRLADREVIAMVYELKNDPRKSTIFVYGDLLVEVKGKPEVWTEQWFSTLSFEGLYE